MSQSYQNLIERKAARHFSSAGGLDIPALHVNDVLYDFQGVITREALRRQRCALFEDCGMGKTLQELEWAWHVSQHTDKPVIVFAPLAVGGQMVDEGRRLGVQVEQARKQSDVGSGPVYVTNYEMMAHFDPSEFGGIVADESSILKDQLGKRRTQIIDFASNFTFRLAATATPSPNDLPELLNHAAFLGRMSVKEALSLWFVQDQQVQHWRLKGHAAEDFWNWCATWAIVARKPRDIGMEFDMPGFDLPPLEVKDHVIPYRQNGHDTLFPMAAGFSEARKFRRSSLGDRVAKVAALVNGSSEPWVVWCEMNDESSALVRAIDGAVEVRGSQSLDQKVEALSGFSSGGIRVLVTKPSIAGHGLNWQHCARVAFVGAGYSYEQYYQAIRRCWRYGQQRPVEVHRVSTEADEIIRQTVERKECTSMSLYDKIPFQMGGSRRGKSVVKTTEKAECGRSWDLHLGDSVDTMRHIESDSVGLSVFSPPFPGMYVYTDSPHDMGNVASIGEMVEQFGHLMDKDHMLRVLMPGRSVFVHITQGVAQLGRDGFMGLKDFRGQIISMMDSAGWQYYGEVTIDKNPQVKAIRTKDSGLMFKSLANDAARMHPALSDMLLQFRKPGQNPEPIRAGHSHKYGNTQGWVTSEDWILWARPVWYADDYQPNGSRGVEGIRETDVLNVTEARSDQDERHLCPLQLSVIERCVKVWSNPGELVYSPFAGIGSEGVVALREGRRFVGGELKPEYWKVACQNLKNATIQRGLFDACEYASKSEQARSK